LPKKIDDVAVAGSTAEERIGRREIPSGFQVWQPIIFGSCAFLVYVAVLRLFTFLYPLYPDYYYYNYAYYTNYNNTYLTVLGLSTLGLYIADGVFLNWSASRFDIRTPLTFWIVFILLLPVAFVWHTWDLHDLRKHNKRKTGEETRKKR
jgi:hypothetical protein